MTKTKINTKAVEFPTCLLSVVRYVITFTFGLSSELEAVLEHFWTSRYRYLHLSCHANNEEMATTLDIIPFQELGIILEPYLEKRRLFLSACSMSCSNLAKRLIPITGCYSILGPSAKVDIADAAIFWAVFLP